VLTPAIQAALDAAALGQEVVVRLSRNAILCYDCLEITMTAEGKQELR